MCFYFTKKLNGILANPVLSPISTALFFFMHTTVGHTQLTVYRPEEVQRSQKLLLQNRELTFQGPIRYHKALGSRTP